MFCRPVIAVVGALLAIFGSEAFAASPIPAPYAFSMDRFELQGNLPGVFIDEFDDGALDPAAWEIVDPTVIESDGAVTFRNPGTLVEAVPGVFELSYIGSKLIVSDENGDFTGTSTWLSAVPELDQIYGMNVSGDGEREIGIHVANLGAPLSDFLGIPSGFGIFFHTHTDAGGLVDGEFFPVNTAAITGNVLLRLAFVDNTNVFDAAFSLDGGVNFQTPFSPVATGPIDFSGWSFGAESFVAVPEPASVGFVGAAIAGGVWMQRRKRRP